METIWHKAPFLRLTLPLILGVLLGTELPLHVELIYWLFTHILLTLLVIIMFRKSWKYRRFQFVFGVILTTVFILLGAEISLHQRLRVERDLNLSTSGRYFMGVVKEYPSITEKSVKLVLKLTNKMDNEQLVESSNEKILAYSPHHFRLDTLVPGDLVVFSSNPQVHKEPINPGQFNYGAYLMKNGIAGTVYFHKKVFASRPESKPFSITEFFAGIQNYCIKIIEESGLRPSELGIASALILGERSLILPETREAFATAGAVHILAVSGLHVGIIYLMVIAIFSKVLPGKKWLRVNLFLTLILLWIYAGVTGFSPSVLRAATMFSFIAIGKHSGRQSNIFNMLAASAFLLIFINPRIITEVGFQLSYLAVLGITLFFKPIYQIFIFKTWFADKAWSLFVVSFAAQLATFPLSVYYFSQFPNLFFITNLIVIPMAMFALYSGLFFVILHFIPIVSEVLAFILNFTLLGLNFFVDWVSSLPMALTDNLHFSVLAVLLIYLLIVALVQFYQDPRRWNLWRPLIILTILCSFWINRKIEVPRKVNITVLEGAKESLLIFRMGKNAMVFTNDTSEFQIEKNNYYIRGYCDEEGIQNVEWKLYSSSFSGKYAAANAGLYHFGGITFTYMSEEQDSDAFKIAPDVAIISKNTPFERVLSLDAETVYIIDSSVNIYHRKKILGELVKRDLPFWDMHYQGVYIARLDEHH